ncbi:MAG: hypothetical protein P1V21_21680 [Rhizobiaceae bacterium]|nr:hypothetical protein [Rhizobiaceae bacterium]
MPNFRLDSRSKRSFFVLILVLSILGATYTTYTQRIIDPEEWYFYTVKSEAIDIRSPTRQVIIEFGFRRSISYKIYEKRCSMKNVVTRDDAPSGAQHRGVWLCNPAGFSGQEFNIRHGYFKEQVDDLYVQYYSRVVERTLWGLMSGLGLWAALLALFVTFRWIRSGQH